MSLDLDWYLLDAQLADSLLAKLNASLSKAPRPDFIGPITLTSLDFGQDAPEVTLTHLGDVWRELSDESAAAAAAAAAAAGGQHPHAGPSSAGGGAPAAVAVRHVASQSSHGYEDEYDEDEEGDVIAPGEQGYRANGRPRAPLRKSLRPGDHLARLAEHSLPFTGPGVVGPRLQTFRQYTPSDIQQVHGGAAGSSLASFPASIPHWANGGGGGGVSGSVSGSGLATPAWGAGLGTRPWPSRSQTAGAAGVAASPYHSGVPTPTTSGYFSHWPSSQQQQQPFQQQYRRPTYWRASNSGLSASRSTPAWGASPGAESGTPDGAKGGQGDPSSSSSQPLPSVQCHFSVVWSTNTLKLGINTSLVINHPTPAFMQLPLSVAVIGLGVQAGVVVAFEEGDEARGTGRRVHVSLVEDESGIGLGGDDEEEEEVDEDQDHGGVNPRRREDTNDTILASGHATTTMAAALASKTRGHISPPQYGSRRASGSQGPSQHAPPPQQRPPTVGERLLPHITLESSVGQADKHVLRNVGKVEKFIAEVLRKAVEDELVWPNFYTVALPGTQGQQQQQGATKMAPNGGGGRRQSDDAETMSNGSL